jgi:hypothetical protein
MGVRPAATSFSIESDDLRMQDTDCCSFVLDKKPGCDNKQKHSNLANLYGREDMKENYDSSKQSNAITIQKMKYSFPSKC